ncbi:MAG: hypothetical protein ACP5FM_08260 [Acidithiobacillus sp.]
MVKLGNVDEEITLQKVRLAKALDAEFDNPDKADYGAIIDRISGRIESLEKTRKLLMDNDPEALKVLVIGGFTNRDHAPDPA